MTPRPPEAGTPAARTGRDGTLRLRVIRWSTRDDGHFYFRCEASLAPAYAPALPLFEAVCDAARVRHFDYPPW